MFQTSAFECGECNSLVVLWDGWKESIFSEDEIDDFEEIVSEFDIAMGISMCSPCDLRYN